jgi:cytochrome P450
VAPPGPVPSLEFDPLAPAQLADPYPVYARARDEQPVLWSEPLGVWVVTRYDDVVAVLRDGATFSSAHATRSARGGPLPEVAAVLAEGHPLSPTLTDSDEPVHRRLRGLVNKAFTHERVARQEAFVRTSAAALLDDVAADGRADLIERFAWPLPLMAIGAVLGVPPADLDDLHRWSGDWLRLQQATDPVDEQVRCARGVVAMQRYFLDALRERRAHPRDDLMSDLLRAEVEGAEPLSDAEAMRIPMNLVIAGHVTVTRAIGNAVVLLLDRPAQVEAMRADADVVAGVVEEALRMESPAQGLFRTVTRDTRVGDVDLPAGARVMVHYGSANRDGARFADADVMDPAREELLRHVAFGKGIHVCLGAPLARLELRIALPMLFERLPGLRLEPGRAPERDTIVFARGFKHLPVVWDPPS